MSSILPDSFTACRRWQPKLYRIPAYDLDALSIEVELLLDWYAPHRARTQLSSGAKATFVSLWRKILTEKLVRWSRPGHCATIIRLI